jgi:hypothetical protein
MRSNSKEGNIILVDIADGDFIGIGADKKLYKISHDPFEVIEVHGSLSEILSTTT